jgi:M6 family metalloprotease-like protein
MTAASVWAAPLRNVPQTRIQPNGDTLRCFASGDEFFHYLHDADDYTIVLDTATGYYTYAIRDGERIKASTLVAGKTDPAKLRLPKQTLPSAAKRHEIITAKREYYRIDRPSRLSDISKAPPAYAPNRGTFNNLVVFIRFSDEPETIFDKPLTYFDDLCNGATSLRSYFQEASYGLMNLQSTFYPLPNGTTVLSYQDAHPRGYYLPYSASNPNGYSGDNQMTEREHGLLANAVTAIASQVPADLLIDSNNDGEVDDVSFFISGASGNWSDLLWPHRWSLYTRSVDIHGKRVYGYLLVPVDPRDLDLGTLCHETFHVFGAPDLYHYYENALSPVSAWDVMEVLTTPPQHMGAYMKYKYGKWIDEIPTITPGRYTLAPLNTSSAGNCYKIPVPGQPQQFYVLEYRRRTDSGFESWIPGSGLLVYRIDTRFEGNADYNGSTILDEIYIFRPGGTQTINGNPANACFSQTAGRTKFNKATDPRPWLNLNTYDDYTSITEVSAVGETISFVYGEYGKVACIDITIPDTVSTGMLVPLTATVLPSDALNKALTWQITDGGHRARIDGPHLIGDAEGTVTLQAAAQDGSGVVAAAKTIYLQRTLVDSIIINTADRLYTGSAVPLTATVLPAHASDKTLAWAVIGGAAHAHIDGTSLVGDTEGTVTIQASAQDGSGVRASREIAVRPYDETQPLQVAWTTQYGADGFLSVESRKGLYRVEIYSTSGAKIKTFPASGQQIQLSFAGLPKGIYVLLVWHDKTTRSSVKVIW